jgi:protein TonB
VSSNKKVDPRLVKLEATRRTAQRERRDRILIGLGGIALFGVIIAGLNELTRSGESPVKRTIQVITLVKPAPLPPPPPPPPPPQKVEFTKAKPMDMKPAKVDDPKPDNKPPAPKAAKDNDDPPPPGPLKLDTAASGADAFGLQAGGGRDITGFGGGGGGSRFGGFISAAQRQIQHAMETDERFASAHFRRKVSIESWWSPDGKLTRLELIGSTGDPELDRALKQLLLAMPAVGQTVPLDMPQPAVLRIGAQQSFNRDGAN